MTLRLINAYTSDNLGDAAIYETLVQLAGPLGASCTLPPDRVKNVRGLQTADAPATVQVSVGGDIFNNARPRLVTRRFLQLVQELRLHDPKRTFVFGQGLPASCRHFSLGWLAQAMKRLSSVTVRDTLSCERLNAAGVHAELGFDTAFAYQMSDGALPAGHMLMELAGIEPERAVLFSVREFDAMYPQDGARFEAQMMQLTKRLLARGHQPALVMQARSIGSDADQAVADRLQAACPGLQVLDPFVLEGLGHAPLDALIGALGLASAVVAVRYHSAVLRMIHGRMPFNLYYSSKGQDLSQRLGVPGVALANFDADLALAKIEATMAMQFEAQPLAEVVKKQFSLALTRARAA